MPNKTDRSLNDYQDILSIERPLSRKHTPMKRENRAVQFAPFAALSGFDDLVDETARLTEPKKQLDIQQKERLDKRLRILQQAIGDRPEISIVYYRQDLQKDGGAYTMYSGSVRRINLLEETIQFESGTQIPFDDLYSIEGPSNLFCEDENV